MIKEKASVRNKNIAAVIFVFALLCVLFSFSYIATTVVLEDTRLTTEPPIELTDGWSSSADKSDENITVLSEPSRRAADSVNKTLTLINTLPSSTADNYSLCFQTKNECVRVWINDDLIYTYGNLYAKNHDQCIGSVWNMVSLPDNSSGQTVTIELVPINANTTTAPYQFYLGTQDGITLYLLKDNLSTLAICIVLAMIGIAAMLFAILNLFRRNRLPSGAVFYFSLFSIIAAVWNASDSALLQFVIGNNSISYLLFGCSFYLLAIPLAMFMSCIFSDYSKIFCSFAIILSVYAIIRILLYVTGIMDFESMLWILHLLIVLLILIVNLIIWIPLVRTKKLVTPELFFAVSTLTLVVSVSLISFYADDKMNELRDSYSSGFLFGVLIFVVIVIIGVMRQTRRIREKAFKAEFFEQRTYTDELTDLLNVRGFDDKCRKFLTTAPKDSSYAIVDFDIDLFSKFNADNGLETGDELLRSIADKLKAVCSNNELCARQDGDHFVCLLIGRSFDDIIVRIKKADAFIRTKTHRHMLLLSYGVVEVTNRSLTPATLRNQALVAKHTIKGNYENNIAIYDYKLHELQMRETSILSNFETSLRNKEYVIFLQPKINSATQTIGGAEALVRHIDANGNITSANQIIDALEKKGFVAKLDFYILEKVCKFQRKCIRNGYKVIPVSSNFSRAHLYDENFPQQIAKIVDKYNLPHDLIEIELTETSFHADKDILNNMVQSMHAYGFKVAIDDFGNGYSSLNILKDVDVDIIKLDRGFLGESIKNHRANTIIEHTVSLIKEMGITSVAEGVEKEAQIKFLSKLGCDFLQGYYYSKPIPEKEFITEYLL